MYQQQKKKKFTPQIYNNPGSYQNQGSYYFGSRWQSINFCQKSFVVLNVRYPYHCIILKRN